MHKPLLLALVCGFATPSPAAELKVTVEAGEFDREDTVVTFPLAVEGERPNVIYQGTRLMPLQFPPGASHATFVLLGLKKGEKASYRMAREPGFKWTEVFELVRQETTVAVRPKYSSMGMLKAQPLARTNVLQYQTEPGPFPRADIQDVYRRGGYLHPIRTRSGRAVTDDFPPNHLHHHGVWSAWTKTVHQGRAPDFWNMGQGKGRVDFVTMEEWNGSVHAGFTARHRFIDLTGPKPIAALNETWEVTAYDATAADGKAWFFDLVSSQRCASTNALKLPKYLYGGIGFRGPWAWNGATNAQFLTSDGETDRVKAHAQRSRWCDVSGVVDGAIAGIALLCHPANFRAPQPMRVHPDEPFFSYAPQQLGDMEIKPGDTYVSRYRFVVHDGSISRAEMDRLWNDYAHPPVARVTGTP